MLANISKRLEGGRERIALRLAPWLNPAVFQDDVKAMYGVIMRAPFTTDEKFAVACAIRDWVHKQPWSECGPGADTCPDWPKAFEIRDVALTALEEFRRR